ncbi:MAG TPA: histidine kinase [Anaerolineales bacterium]|nr:histidine kinase [Anaerolineales bacterium]
MLTDGDPNGLGDFESWESSKQSIRTELEQSRQQLKEIGRKIDHSQGEVSRLTQRNATITATIQQVRSQFDNTPREKIRDAYEAGLEAVQRLFVMRGQLERLQSEYEEIKRYVNLLEKIDQLMEKGESVRPGSAGSFASVEMMIQAQEAERQRLSRQMHDGPAQALSNFILQTEIAGRLFDVDQNSAREELQVLKAAATNTFKQVRDFIFQLRPMMLDDLGMVPTVRRYVDAVQEQSGLEITIAISGAERRLEPYLEVVVFRSIQELLNNAISHSQASEIKIQLDVPENEIRVSVDDNGNGFDTSVIESRSNLGLKLIKERAEIMGGEFEVDSVIGHGTRVHFRIPIVKTPSPAY